MHRVFKPLHLFCTSNDLSALRTQGDQLLELGRSCLKPAYRDGQAIQKLWEGIAQYIHHKPYRYLIGCASLPGHWMSQVNQIYSLLVKRGAPEQWFYWFSAQERFLEFNHHEFSVIGK